MAPTRCSTNVGRSSSCSSSEIQPHCPGELATTAASSVVLPNPAGAVTSVSGRSIPSRRRSIKRGRGTKSRPNRGGRSFVTSSVGGEARAGVLTQALLGSSLAAQSLHGELGEAGVQGLPGTNLAWHDSLLDVPLQLLCQAGLVHVPVRVQVWKRHAVVQ